jgi:hypothetical protein
MTFSSGMDMNRATDDQQHAFDRIEHHPVAVSGVVTRDAQTHCPNEDADDTCFIHDNNSLTTTHSSASARPRRPQRDTSVHRPRNITSEVTPRSYRADLAINPHTAAPTI